MQSLAGLPAEIELAKSDLLDIYNGAVAEQFVGQELRAAARGSEPLFYWSRKGGSAEVVTS